MAHGIGQRDPITVFHSHRNVCPTRQPENDDTGNAYLNMRRVGFKGKNCATLTPGDSTTVVIAIRRG
jgi:hypothetical protein